jgi:hypothetical protein
VFLTETAAKENAFAQLSRRGRFPLAGALELIYVERCSVPVQYDHEHGDRHHRQYSVDVDLRGPAASGGTGGSWQGLTDPWRVAHD